MRQLAHPFNFQIWPRQRRTFRGNPMYFPPYCASARGRWKCPENRRWTFPIGGASSIFTRADNLHTKTVLAIFLFSMFFIAKLVGHLSSEAPFPMALFPGVFCQCCGQNCNKFKDHTHAGSPCFLVSARPTVDRHRAVLFVPYHWAGPGCSAWFCQFC